MRVLLIQPPIEDFYTTPIRLYPLGLLYTAGVLQQMGFEVQILDGLTPLKKQAIPLPGDFAYLRPFIEKDLFLFKRYYRFGRPMPAIIDAVKSFSPDMIGISVQFTAYYQSVAELVNLLKSNIKAPIFIGGNHASFFAAEIQQRTPLIDAVLTGPAESSLPDFFFSRFNGERPAREPLDWKKIQPAHELLSAAAYRIGRKNYVSLAASRGCPHGCDYCGVQAMFGRGIEYRGVSAVIREMKWNAVNREVRIFNFEDDNLSYDKDWFTTLLKFIAVEPALKGIELTAMNGLCYSSLDEKTLTLMRRAGFRRLNLAFVTRDHHIRRRYHRPDPGQNIESVITAAKQRGFLVTVYVIIGLPEQTYDEIKDSVDYLLELGVLVGPSPFYLSPGSALYNTMVVQEDIRKNWNLYRSSAFAVETDHLSREQLISLFAYTRRNNLETKTKRQ